MRERIWTLSVTTTAPVSGIKTRNCGSVEAERAPGPPSDTDPEPAPPEPSTVPFSDYISSLQVLRFTTTLKNTIQDTSKLLLNPRLWVKPNDPPQWDRRAKTHKQTLAESLVSDIMCPDDCLLPFPSIYQEQPTGKHIKHINPQESKHSFIFSN